MLETQIERKLPRRCVKGSSLTRPGHTDGERRAQTELFAHLFREGQPAHMIERAVQDRPDLAFETGGKVVACECVQFPSSKILQWEHKRRKDLLIEDGKVRVVGTIWPIEVHSWIKEAVEGKASGIPSYKAAVSANEVWLFVHSHSDRFLDKIFNDRTVRQASYGAQCARHAFDRIYFFDVRCGVQLIYEPGMPKLEISHNLDAGYPAMTSYQYAGAPFQFTAGEAEEPHLFEYEVEEAHTIFVKPIDPTYAKRAAPACRIKPARRLRIKAFHNRAEHQLIFD